MSRSEFLAEIARWDGTFLKRDEPDTVEQLNKSYNAEEEVVLAGNPGLPRSLLAARFRSASDADLRTDRIFIREVLSRERFVDQGYGLRVRPIGSR